MLVYFIFNKWHKDKQSRRFVAFRRWDWVPRSYDRRGAGSLWGVRQCNFRYTKNARTGV